MFCVECQAKQLFDLEDVFKTCRVCSTKSSYVYTPRKQWTYAKSYPDIESITPWNQPCSPAIKDRFDDVQESMQLLTQREREVIELLWEGKTQGEVSRLLNLTQPRVAACLRTARKKIADAVIKKPD